MIVSCSLERRWIAEGTRHRPERLAWNNVDSHWPVCVDWTGGAFVRAQSLRSCQMNKCHFTIIMSCLNAHYGTFGKYSDKFGFRNNWISVTSRHFTSLHNYHVVCSIHTSEHSVNFWPISFSEKFGLRITVAFGHPLFFIAWMKFEFFIIFLLRHVFTLTFVTIRYTKHFSKYPSYGL